METLWIGFSLIIRSSSTNVVGGNCSDRASGGRPCTLAVENTKPRQFAPPALICENQFVSITKGRNYFAIVVKINEVYCKLQSYIHLLGCTHCVIQWLGLSITSLNLRMNIDRSGKTGCEISINHYRNPSKNITFLIQFIEKLPGNGYKNKMKYHDMLEYRLQRKDYRINHTINWKWHCTIKGALMQIWKSPYMFTFI